MRDRVASAVDGGMTSSRSVRGASGSHADFDSELGDPPPAALEALTRAWQARAISNFEFLAHLNSAAGRTAVDLTQYPVYPWCISGET